MKHRWPLLLLLVLMAAIFEHAFAFDPEWPIVPSDPNFLSGVLGEYRPGKNGHFHGGVDIKGTNGVTIVGVADAGVIHAKRPFFGNAGNTYEIVHNDGHVTEYMHLNETGFQYPVPPGTPTIIPDNQGTPVSQGHPLAFVGKTGDKDYKPHLHFGIRDIVTFTPTPTSTRTFTPTSTPTLAPSVTGTPATATFSPTLTSTPTPTNSPSPPAPNTDFRNPFDWLVPSVDPNTSPRFRQVLVLPEGTSSKVEPWNAEDPYVKPSSEMAGAVIISLPPPPLPPPREYHIKLRGKCKFVANALDQFGLGNQNKFSVYGIGYYPADTPTPTWRYKIEFDKIAYSERDKEQYIYRTYPPYQSKLGDAWYKLYWEYSPTPVSHNIKQSIDNGIFDGTAYPVGMTEAGLWLEASRYPFLNSPTPSPKREKLIIHVINATYWVDCDSGNDVWPGTFDWPFRTITQALAEAIAGDYIIVKNGTCEYSDGERFPLHVPSGVRIEGMGYYSGGTEVDGYQYPGAAVFECTDCGPETVISNLIITGGQVGVSLTRSSPEISHCLIGGNSYGGIRCEYHESPYILNNLIRTNGGDGIYTNNVTSDEFMAVVQNNTINGNTNCGIYISDFSIVYITDNIISNNGEWGIYAEVQTSHYIAYDCLYGNSGAFNGTPLPGTGMIYDNPDFTGGPHGYYYLGQDKERQISPCIDSGSTSPEDRKLSDRTTDSLGNFDHARLDIGFHHESVPATVTVTPEPSATAMPSGTPTEGPFPTITPYLSPTPIPTPQYSGSMSEGFESTLPNWTLDPLDSLWHVVSNNSSDPYYTEYAQVSEGSRAMWYGQNDTGNYDAGTTNCGSLISPTILLTESVSLVFDSWELTEGNDYGFDTRKVFLSIDNGESWDLLYQSNDNRAIYHQVVCDLSGYLGLEIRIKFEFDTVDNRFNDFRGWFIDNVRVELYRPIPSFSPAGSVLMLIVMGIMLGSMTIGGLRFRQKRS